MAALLLTLAGTPAAQAVEDEELDLDELPELTVGATVTVSIAGGASAELGVLTVDEGVRLHGELVSGPTSNVTFEVVNRYGRKVADHTATAITPIRLMDGPYLVRAKRTGTGSASSFDFKVHVLDDLEDTLTLGTATGDTIEVARAVHRYDFTWTGGWLALDLGGAAAGFDWRIDDAVGRTVCTHEEGAAVFTLPAGAYTLHVGGAADDTGAYTLTLDATADPGVVDELTLGIPTLSTLAPGVTHVWTFDADEGDRLTFAPDVIDDGVRWRVRDPDGGVVAQGEGSASSFELLVLGEGEHSVELTNLGTAPAGYDFAVAETVVVDAVIAFDQFYGIELPGVGSILHITLPEEGPYEIMGMCAGCAKVAIYDELGFGRSIPLQDSTFNTVLLGNGLWTLRIEGEDVELTVGVLAIDYFVQSVLLPAAVASDVVGLGLLDVLDIEFEASPGDKVSVGCDDDACNGRWRLYDAAGRLLGEGSPLEEQSPPIVPLAGGAYRLRVDPAFGASVKVVLGDEGSVGTVTPDAADPLDLDDPVLVEVAASSAEFLELDLSAELAPVTVTFTGTGVVGNLSMSIRDLATGEYFDWPFADTFLPNEIGPVPLVPGVYHLRIGNSGSSAGEATITAATAPAGRFHWTGTDPIREARLTAAEPVHVFPLDLDAAGTWWLDLQQGGPGVVWEVVGPGCTPSGVAFAEHVIGDDLAITVAYPTRCFLVVERDDEDAAVIFDLLFDDGTECEFAPPRPLELDADSPFVALAQQGALTIGGAAASGTIGAQAQGHAWTLEVSAVADVRFAFSGSAGLQWRLRDAQGQVRPVDLGGDAVRLGPGTYTVGVLRSETGGSYTIRVRDAAPAPSSPTFDARIGFDVPAAAHAKVFGFTLTETKRIRFEGPTQAGPLRWHLVDAHGQVWFEGSFIPGVMQQPTLLPGTYRLVLERRPEADPLAAVSSDIAVYQPQRLEETLALGDEVQGSFLIPGSVAIYRVEVEDDGTPVQISVIRTFSYGGPQDSYTTDVPLAFFDPYGNAIQPWTEHDSGRRTKTWRLDAGTYELRVSTRFTTGTAEWDLKVRGVADANRTLWFGHDMNLGEVWHFYGISSMDARVEDGELQLGAVKDLWNKEQWIWSMVWAPDGDVVMSTEAPGTTQSIQKIDLRTGQREVHNLGARARLVMDTSGLKVWMPAGRKLGEVSLYPFGTVLWRTVVGDDPARGITFDADGRAWYTSIGGASGILQTGHFGLLDLDTFRTTRMLSVWGGTSISFDPYTGHLMVTARDKVYQYEITVDEEDGSLSLTELAVVDLKAHDPRLVALAAPTFDGLGKMFLQAQLGRFEVGYLDYAASGLIDAPSNTFTLQHLDRQATSFLPLVGPGSPCYAAPGASGFEPVAGTKLPIGTPVVLTGSTGIVNPTRPIASILVDGEPARFDATGRFFHPYVVKAGPQVVPVEISDRCGTLEQAFHLVGVDPSDPGTIVYTDVTAQVATEFRDTTWHAGLRVLEVEVTGTNTTDSTLRGPLRLIVGPAPGAWKLLQADGQAEDGRPAVTMLPPGELLEAEATLPWKRLTLENPAILSLRANARWEYGGNQPPWFTSVPVLEGVVDQPWSYLASAEDRDGDTLTFSLETGPHGMLLDAESGLLVWTPDAPDAGLHPVSLVVSDGRGGKATQRFMVYVRTGALNSPPMFTTRPPVHLESETSLLYDADAIDLEGDTLTFAMLDGPQDAVLDTVTGELTWEEPEDGQYAFTLEVSDGRGGSATQSWLLTVGEGPGGHPPTITTFPPLVVPVGGLYAYVPKAEDPDGDVLTWSLDLAPSQAGADGVTGRLLFTPKQEHVGTHPFELSVTDGTHVAMQRWVVTVTEAPPNQPPVFTSLPHQQAQKDVEYRYQARARDPEGEKLTFDLFSGPSGATVDPKTGLVTFLPDAVGTVPFVLRVQDPGGAAALQAWVVPVRETNQAPVVWVDPASPVPVKVAWSHRSWAYDPDGDAVTFSLRDGPADMSIHPESGRITWVPDEADVSYLVTVVGTDPIGAEGTAELAVSVVRDATPPQVEVRVASGDLVCTGRQGRVCVIASDDLGPLRSRRLDLDGAPRVTDEHGCVTVTWGPDAVPMAFLGRAWDQSGNLAHATLEVTPQTCPTPPSAPLVKITAPGHGEQIGRPRPVHATISPSLGAEISHWQVLAYRSTHDGVVPANARQVAEGFGAPPTGALGTFDTTLAENGLWTLRVEATDSASLTTWDEVAVEVMGDFKPGRYDVSFEDFRMPVGSTELVFTRHYDTLRADTVGDFGYGWRLGMTNFKVTTNGKLGRPGFSTSMCEWHGTHPLMCHTVDKKRLVAVTWPDGRTEIFEFMPKNEYLVAAFIMTPTFKPLYGATSTLRVDPSWQQTGWFDWSNGRIFGGWFATEGIYDPPRYEIEDKFGNRYLLDPDTGLVKQTDRFGNTVLITETGIEVSNGPDLAWARGDEDRIERLDLPDGERVLYGYDLAGDLAAVTYQDDVVDEYDYDTEHLLLSFGTQGRSPLRTLEYDGDGRLVREEDAGQVAVTHAWDASGGTITSVGPDPRLTTTLTFEPGGLLTQRKAAYVDPDDGPQELVTRFTYDERRRLSRRELPGGASQEWGYDDRDNITHYVDAIGVYREFTWGPFAQLAEELISGQRSRVIEVEPSTRITTVRRNDGNRYLELERDIGGRLVRLDNASGHSVRLSYTGSHSEPASLEIRGSDDVVRATIALTRDGAGRVVEAAYALAGGGTFTRRWEYDPRGRLSKLVDPNDRTQAMTYDVRDQLASYTDKDGKTTIYVHDDAGRLTSRTNRLNQQTSFSYDAAGRLTSITSGPMSRTFTYDPLGRMTSATTGEHTLTFAHDERGLVESRSGGLHPEAVFAFERDEAGRPKRTVGPHIAGQAEPLQDVTYRFDSLGNLDTLTEATLGKFEWVYDERGRPASLIRPNDVATFTTYTDDDRVESLETETGHALTYAYDALGLLEAWSDEDGEHTVVTDARGRLLAVDHPSTSPLEDEAYAYDASDRRTAWTGHDAADVEYDDADRLVADGTFTYQYDDEGRRVSRTHKVTEAVTAYVWDRFDQLVRVEEPDGGAWLYRYDAFGRRVQVEHREGEEETTYLESFVYDDRGLVRVVVDGSGGVVASYVTGFGHGAVLAELRSAFHRYPVHDRLGSVEGWLDEEGELAEQVLRNAYGERAGGPPSVVEPYGYTGHAEDPNGLAWGRARYLEPATGRWLAEDPVPFEPRYAYVGGLPLDLTDPTGTSAGYETAQVKKVQLTDYESLKLKLIQVKRVNLTLVRVAKKFEAERQRLGHDTVFATEFGAAYLSLTGTIAELYNAAFPSSLMGMGNPYIFELEMALADWLQFSREISARRVALDETRAFEFDQGQWTWSNDSLHGYAMLALPPLNISTQHEMVSFPGYKVVTNCNDECGAAYNCGAGTQVRHGSEVVRTLYEHVVNPSFDPGGSGVNEHSCRPMSELADQLIGTPTKIIENLSKASAAHALGTTLRIYGPCDGPALPTEAECREFRPVEWTEPTPVRGSILVSDAATSQGNRQMKCLHVCVRTLAQPWYWEPPSHRSADLVGPSVTVAEHEGEHVKHLHCAFGKLLPRLAGAPLSWSSVSAVTGDDVRYMGFRAERIVGTNANVNQHAQKVGRDVLSYGRELYYHLTFMVLHYYHNEMSLKEVVTDPLDEYKAWSLTTSERLMLRAPPCPKDFSGALHLGPESHCQRSYPGWPIPIREERPRHIDWCEE